METLSVFIRFTKEELRDLLNILNHEEGYLPYSQEAHLAMNKLQMAYDNFDAKDEE